MKPLLKHPVPGVGRTCQRLYAVFIGLGLFLGACDQAPPPPKISQRVIYTVVEEKAVEIVTELPGRVSAFTISEVRPQVSGIIRDRLFDEGSDVRAGQIMYRIDPALYQAAYDTAKAELARAEANEFTTGSLASRYRRLVMTDAVSKQNRDTAVGAHDEAKAAVEAARAALETARINLEYCEVRAPISGRVGHSHVTQGALATQNQETPLATIQQLNPVYVDVTRPTADLLRWQRQLARGVLDSSGPNSVRVKLMLEDGAPYVRNLADDATDAEPDWIEGELLFSDVTVQKSTGVVTSRARFPNPDVLLLPGLYVRALISEGVRNHSILIPQRAVWNDSRGQPHVMVLSKQPDPSLTGDDVPVLEGDQYFILPRRIDISRDLNAFWLVENGLKAGDLLVVDGQQKARAGDVVTGAPLQTHD